VATKSGSLQISADNSLHNASTRALSPLLNISEIMIAPPAKKPQINRGLARSICNRLLLPAWQPCKNTPHETLASF
jgi:hypothetical protein